MNLVKHELKRHRLSTLIWTAGLVSFFIAGFTKYQAFELSGDVMNQFMDSFPTILKSVFGMNNMDLSDFGSYYAMLLLYGLVMISLQGLYLGINLAGREQADKTTDFILTRPISRGKYMAGKWLSGLIIILFIDTILTVSQLYYSDKFEEDYLIHAMFILLSTHILMLGLGFFLAIVNPSKGDKIGLIIILFLYLWPVIMDLLESNLRKFSLFSWFYEYKINEPDLNFYLINISFIIVGLVLFIISARLFRKADIV